MRAALLNRKHFRFTSKGVGAQHFERKTDATSVIGSVQT